MRLSVPIHQLKRRAKLLSRDRGIPLHEALDLVARQEGFARWSLLSARVPNHTTARNVLRGLDDGDMLLIGARPGQGKTRLGMQLLLEAARTGRHSVFFTLEYSEKEAAALFRLMSGGAEARATPDIVTSEEISADFLCRYLEGMPKGGLAVIDYLQILDQKRSTPPIADQLQSLRSFARSKGVVLGFISQVDRFFDPAGKAVPTLNDIRLPNPIPAGIFDKTCFLHADDVRLQRVA